LNKKSGLHGQILGRKESFFVLFIY